MSTARFNERPRCLSSFWYLKNRPLRETIQDTYGGTPPDFMLDSGAFTAWHGGHDLPLQDYIDFIQKFRDLFTVYVAQDVIEDWEASRENTEEMERQGLSPLPVYHAGSPLKELDRLMERYDYFALGGMAPWPVKQRRMIMLDWWKHIEARGYEGRIHGFAVTSMELMRTFPWYSVDSSTWTQPFRWGSLSLFDGGRVIQVKVKEPREMFRQERLLRRYGYNLARLTKDNRSRARRQELACISLMNWMECEDWIAARRPGQFRMYFAHTIEWNEWPPILSLVREQRRERDD